MKISLIELHFHFDCVDGFCKIIETSNHEMQVFTLPWIYDHLRNEKYLGKFAWHLSDTRNLASFFKKNINKINDADLIFIDTIAWQYGAYNNAGFTRPVIVRVHNAHKLFAPWDHIQIRLTPFYIWKAMSYFLREMVLRSYWYYRPRLIDKIDYFVFPDEGITEYVVSHGYVDKDKVLPPIPLKVYEESVVSNPDEGGPLRITIIGSIDERRRDYSVVVEAFKILAPLVKKKLILTLLGKPKGKYAKQVIRNIKKLESGFFHFEYFDGAVQQVEFDRIMATAHIILSPIKTETTAEIFKEVYGKTKITGSLLDMIRFPRTTIIPSNYTPGKDFNEMTVKFDNAAHLAQIISHYLDNREELKRRNDEIKSRIRDNFSAKSISEYYLNEIFTKLAVTNEQVKES